MVTTIQISSELLQRLQKMKMHDKESYEDLIWDLMEDRMELSKETKEAMAEYEKDVREKRWENFTPIEQVMKEFGVNV